MRYRSKAITNYRYETRIVPHVNTDNHWWRILKAWWGGGEGWNVGRVYLFPLKEGSGKGRNLPEQNSLEMACFGAFCAVLLSMCSPEKCWISAWSGDLVDVKYVLMGSSEFSVRVMGFVSFLLYCNACNANKLVLEILKHDKIWGTIYIRVPHSKFWGTCPPCQPPWFTLVPIISYELLSPYPVTRPPG